jgi:uncharacterized protein
MPYLDTSILGAFYCPESLSPIADRAISGRRDVVISLLAELELCSLLSLEVRTRELSRAEASAALGQYRIHVANGQFQFVEIGHREHELARDWLSRFTSPPRTLDALHLAAAFANGQELFTTDKRLAGSAKELGLPCRLFR